jgi:hypothetical protein
MSGYTGRHWFDVTEGDAKERNYGTKVENHFGLILDIEVSSFSCDSSREGRIKGGATLVSSTRLEECTL